MKRSLYIHPREFVHKTTCDALLDKCAEHFTDLHAYIQYGDGLFVAQSNNLFRSRLERIDGAWPFDYFLAETHRRGMRVHAILSVGGWWFWYVLNTPVPAEWNCASRLDCDESWYNFSIPAAREFMAGTLETIVRVHPDLDGLTLDYIRYPSGFEDVEALQADDVTEAVRLVREAIPRIHLGAATSGHRKIRVKQDWPTWLDRGTIDTAMPMCYRYMEDPTITFPNYLTLLEPYDKTRIHPVISTRPRDGVALTNEELEQETALVEESGFAGVSYFSASNLRQVPEHWEHLPTREAMVDVMFLTGRQYRDEVMLSAVVAVVSAIRMVELEIVSDDYTEEGQHIRLELERSFDAGLTWAVWCALSSTGEIDRVTKSPSGNPTMRLLIPEGAQEQRVRLRTRVDGAVDFGVMGHVL